MEEEKWSMMGKEMNYLAWENYENERWKERRNTGRREKNKETRKMRGKEGGREWQAFSTHL